MLLKDANGNYTGKDGNQYRVDNTAFEPKKEVGTYQGQVRSDGKVGERVELRDKDNINNANVDVRNNVQIHVGGTYTNAEGQNRVTGSLGCFTLSGKDSGNQGVTKFMNDIKTRVENNQKAGNSSVIIINVVRRSSIPNFNKK